MNYFNKKLHADLLAAGWYFYGRSPGKIGCADIYVSEKEIDCGDYTKFPDHNKTIVVQPNGDWIELGRNDSRNDRITHLATESLMRY